MQNPALAAGYFIPLTVLPTETFIRQ